MEEVQVLLMERGRAEAYVFVFKTIESITSDICMFRIHIENMCTFCVIKCTCLSGDCIFCLHCPYLFSAKFQILFLTRYFCIYFFCYTTTTSWRKIHTVINLLLINFHQYTHMLNDCFIIEANMQCWWNLISCNNG